MAVGNVNAVVVLRIEKSLTSNPGIRWRNTYEAVNTTGGQSAAQLVAMVNAIASAESQLHATSVRYERATLSTFAEEVEYNPPDLLVRTFDDLFGKRSVAGTDLLDLRTCLAVKREVDFGRQGNILYRGCLTELGVQATAGLNVLTTAELTAVNAILNTFYTAVSGAATATGFDLVMARRTSSGLVNVRSITGFAATGVTVKKLNNRYFDRA